MVREQFIMRLNRDCLQQIFSLSSDPNRTPDIREFIEYLKDLLFIIRTSRKVLEDPVYICDKFCTDTALGQWVDDIQDEWQSEVIVD